MSKRMPMPKAPFLKLSDTLKQIRTSLNKDKFDSVSLYFQDESRFGLKTLVGRCLSTIGIRLLVAYQHKFASTYLWGSYSPVDGDSFVWEINGVDGTIFKAYLNALSIHRPNQYKILVIDNAAFHSTKYLDIPENIHLLRIPPYCPELNPCEQIWQHIKYRFRNKRFEDMATLRKWLWEKTRAMKKKTIKSITSNHNYLNAFLAYF